jgi:hypothetical protein
MTLKAETGDRIAAGITYEDKPEGPIAAAIIAGGIGSLALGFFTVLAEASKGAKAALNLYDPVGPLAGKTVFAVVIWLLSWGVLHVIYRNKPFESRKALTVALVLMGLGVLGTFPIFFQAFAPHTG